jgi:hypothetical protein
MTDKQRDALLNEIRAAIFAAKVAGVDVKEIETTIDIALVDLDAGDVEG